MKEIQQLRRIAVRLGVSGTAIPIAETRLYKGGYGFVMLQCYVPVTQNRSPTTSPLCTVFRSTVDKFGNRKQFNKDIYNMLYVDDAVIENAKYMVFECPLPSAFTDTVGELEMVFTYSEVNSDDKAVTRLTSGIYKTNVGDSDLSDGETVDKTGGELARLNDLTIKLEQFDDRTSNVPNLVASIQKVAPNAITYTDNSGIVSAPIVIEGGDTAPMPLGAASTILIPETAWQPAYNASEAVTGYTVTITAAQHGQMCDGATPNDLWVSFDTTESGVITGANTSYTVSESGDITLSSTVAIQTTVRVWNGKGLVDVTARAEIAAETERAEGVEESLQAQIDDIEQSGVDLKARAEIAAETERAEAVEQALHNAIDTNASDISNIERLIPSSTSTDNPLTNEAFVNSSINNMAAFYITSNAQGEAFATRASLLNSTTFYQGGQTRVPTQNDYAIVLADESQPQGVDGKYPTTRYSYQGGTYPDGQWDFQYVVNNTSLTQAQVDAINSGITAELVQLFATKTELSQAIADAITTTLNTPV